MVNIVSGETFHIYDKQSSRLPKPPGWLSLRTMEDEINHILSRSESKFCAPNGHPCTSKTVGLLARRHIVAGEFHYIGKEASTRWAGGPDPSMHIYDKHSSKLPKPPGWLSLRTMEDEINHILSRAESKFRAPNGAICTSRTVGLLTRRHIVAGEFQYIGKEASTRCAGDPDPSMLADAGALDPADETCRVYERVVDPKYLDQIRTEAKQFSTKLLSRRSGAARSAIMNFKKGRNTIKPVTLRKLTRAIHALQNKSMKN